MSIIDSHCHLDFSVLADNLDDVLARAQQRGVTQYVLPSVTANRFESVLHLARAYPSVHPALGLHPCFCSIHSEFDLEVLSAAVQQNKVCAVGEIGLDLFIESPNIDYQKYLFVEQLKIAEKNSLPVIIHVRKAQDMVLQLLKQHRFTQGGIIHAFNGSEQQAYRYINEFGFKLGFGGSLTYPRANKIRKLAADLPLDALVLETDSPDMPLYNMETNVNEPSNTSTVLQVMAGLRSESIACIASQLVLNTRSVLHLDSYR